MSGLGQVYLPGTSGDEVHARGYAPLQTWTHLALTYDLVDRKVRLFINGEFDIESNFAGSSAFPTSSSFLSVRLKEVF